MADDRRSHPPVVGRTLPHNLEAERSVLGAILIDNATFNEASAALTAPMFFRDGHQRIFRAMTALAERQQPIDLTTLKEELELRKDLEEVGGPAYVASLVDGVPRSTNVAYYAAIVRDKAKLRKLIFAANKILGEAYESDQQADQVLDAAEQTVMAVGSAVLAGDFVLAEDWMRETYTQIEKADLDKRIVTGIPSGIDTLDKMTRGFQRSDLIYLGARPSSGKTALALQLALEASKHTMTGFISLEMSRRVVGMRAVALEGRIDAFRLMTGHLSEWEMKRAGEALNAIGARRLAIDDATGSSATQLRAKARRFASRYGLGMLFIDYMQLVHDTVDAENRNQELSKISWGWKSLARELDIPVFVLSQLSRGVTKDNRRPQVSDLRDSGSLEQDADLVLLLYRPHQGESGKFQDGEEAEIIVGKQRNGPIGPVRLQWIGEQMRFGPLEEQASEPTQERLAV